MIEIRVKRVEILPLISMRKSPDYHKLFTLE